MYLLGLTYLDTHNCISQFILSFLFQIIYKLLIILYPIKVIQEEIRSLMNNTFNHHIINSKLSLIILLFQDLHFFY